MLAAVAAPYETAAAESMLPQVGNPGPLALARYQRRNVALNRHFYRTDGMYRSAFDASANAVVGTGPTPRTKFRELAHMAKAWFSETDPTGVFPLGLQISNGFRDSSMVGGAFGRFRPRYLTDGFIVPLQLQMLECEYLPFEKTEIASNGNRIVNGIEIDALGGPAAYHFYRAHPNDLSLDPGLIGQFTRVPASEVVHFTDPSRLGGFRGEGRGTAALLPLWYLHTMVQNKVKQGNLYSKLAAFIKDTEGRQVRLDGEDEDVDDETGEIRAREHFKVLQFEAGDLIRLPSSTDVEFPTLPSVAGDLQPMLRLLGLIVSASIGVPYEIVTGDWAGVSDRTAVYSGTYFETFIRKQRMLIEHQVLRPLWRRFVDLCIATGLWTPPKGIPDYRLYEVSWSWPRRSYKHPVQEIQALVQAIQAGLMDRYTAIEELGYDPEEVDLRQATALVRTRLLGLKYTTHDDTGNETDATKRLSELDLEQLEKLLAELEQADTDEGVLD